jgi:branched-chain amino acid transport system substrate-binding protein
MTSSQRLNINRRALLASTAAALVAMPAIVRAQRGPLRVGVLLPRSGVQAVIGRDCQRAVELAPPILKDLGLPDLAIMNADTESNVDTARARAEKLINDGAQLLVGAFDSGHTTAIAQVAEQKGIPLVINIAASPASEQYFERALTVAREQQVKSCELRAAMRIGASLARSGQAG